MVNEIDEKIVNEILIPAGVWPISERITYSIAKSEIDYDAFLLLKNKDYDFLGFNLGPKRKIQHQVKRIKNGYLTSSDTFSDSEEEEEADKSNQTMSSSPDADGGAREWKPLEMDEFTRQQMNKHEEYKEKTREYKKAYMRAYRKRNRAKLNEYNRLYNANGRARARQNSLNGDVSNFVIKQERQEVNVTDNTPSSNIVSTTAANLNNYPMISPISAPFISPIQSTSAYSSIENDAAMRLAAATFLRAFMKADPITAATALPALQPPSIPIASNAVVDFSQHLAVAAEANVANVAEIVGSECDGRRLRPRIFKKNSTVKNV